MYFIGRFNNRNVVKEIAKLGTHPKGGSPKDNFKFRIWDVRLGIEHRVGGWRSGPAGLEVRGKME